MKLIKQLLINKIEYPLIQTDVQLELSAFGRAEFLIKSELELEGLVEFIIGYDQLFPFFTGYIYSSQQDQKGTTRIIARELSSVLENVVPLGLRHIYAEDLLKEVEAATGLSFLVAEDADYLKKRLPFFYHLGTARESIQCFKEWGIKQGIWSQLPDGKIFWGDYQDSPFSKKQPLIIPEEFILDRDLLDHSFSCVAIPALRPGVRIQNEMLIESIQLLDERMRLRWLKR